MERERNTIKERLNSTKRLDELGDDEGRLKRLNEEDQAIIDDATHQNSIKRPLEKGLRQEMKIFCGLKLRYRKEKISCLSEKGSSRSSKNMRDRDGHLFGRGLHNRRGYWGNYQRFEKTRNRFGK